MDIRIYYEDTDCGGVVYYANYLRYFERARTEYFETRGIFVKECIQKGFFFVVAHQDIDYKAPAHYGDILTIETGVSKVSSASLTFDYLVKRKGSHEPSGKIKEETSPMAHLIASGSTVLVCVDKNIQPTRIPKEVREKLR